MSLLHYRRAANLVLHLLLVPWAYGAAFMLRFDFAIPPRYAVLFLRTLPMVVAIQLAALGLFGLYRSWWRFSGITDLQALLKATTCASALMLGVFYLSGFLHGFPRSVFLLNWGITVMLLGGFR